MDEIKQALDRSHPTVLVTGVGTTEASHLLATHFRCAGVIENWDRERRMYPGYLHLAVHHEPAHGGGTVCLDPASGDHVPVTVMTIAQALTDLEFAVRLFHRQHQVDRRWSPLPVLPTSNKPWPTPSCAELLTEAKISVGELRTEMVPGFLTQLADHVHANNVKAGWWTDLETGEDLHGKRNIGEMLMLCVTELSEAMEGHRKGLPDDKLPHRPMFRVELVDTIIRLLDILGSEENDTHPAGDIFNEKLTYNANRADHKPENRRKAGGKKI